MRLPTQLLLRKPDSNKADFGHILILAGSARFSGAAVLCSTGAMRSGAGLVTLGIPKSINSAIIKIKLPEVMTLPLAETSSGSIGLKALKQIIEFTKKADLVIIGPGLALDNQTKNLVRKLAATIKKPVVIDADGINALSGKTRLIPFNSVMTPHPLEMARLSGISINDILNKPQEIACEFAKKHKITLVLKGHETVVADHTGECYINNTGNPGMATAGSGDVLAGMIGAFIGQGLSTFNSAKYAVYLHGLAGDLAAKEKTQISLIASDIIDKIPSAIKISR